ncbi:MAG: fibronectin type III domain-containing protein [Elusimicrobia bacterium]|nr:fibronectin type III domain-containing protein [Elusimicrobiota bacterium]
MRIHKDFPSVKKSAACLGRLAAVSFAFLCSAAAKGFAEPMISPLLPLEMPSARQGDTFELPIKFDGYVTQTPQRVFVHFVDLITGEIKFGADFTPDPPTTSWEWNLKPGMKRTIRVPAAGVPNGTWGIDVGLYNDDGGTLQLYPVRPRAGSPFMGVLIGTLRVGDPIVVTVSFSPGGSSINGQEVDINEHVYVRVTGSPDRAESCIEVNGSNRCHDGAIWTEMSTGSGWTKIDGIWRWDAVPSSYEGLSAGRLRQWWRNMDNRNEEASAWVTITNTKPPVITQVRVAEFGPNTAKISWITDEPATSQVLLYNSDGSFKGFTYATTDKVTNHAVVIGLAAGQNTDLVADTDYQYEVRSNDMAGVFGNLATWPTPPAPPAPPAAREQFRTAALSASPPITVTISDRFDGDAVGALDTRADGYLRVTGLSNDNADSCVERTGGPACGQAGNPWTQMSASPSGGSSNGWDYTERDSTWRSLTRGQDHQPFTGTLTQRWRLRNSATNVSASVKITNTKPPVITHSVSEIGPDTAKISWTTDEPAESQVIYGPFGNLGSFDPYGTAAQLLEGSKVLSGLIPNTKYEYKVRSRDAFNNQADPVGGSFTTLAKVPTGLGATAIGTDKIRFSWGRNGNPEGTQYQAECDTSDTFTGILGAGKRVSAWTAATSFDFTGLAANTRYYFRVRAQNSANPVVQTAFMSPVSATTHAMAVMTLSAVENGTRIEEIAPGSILYGKVTGLGPNALSCMERAGFNDGTCFDIFGNPILTKGDAPPTGWNYGADGVWRSAIVLGAAYPPGEYKTFWRGELGLNWAVAHFTITPAPLAITNVSVAAVFPSSAVISWKTIDLANSQVEYDLESAVPGEYSKGGGLDQTPVTDHSRVIGYDPLPLIPNTAYRYRVRSKNATREGTRAGPLPFTTLAEVPAALTVLPADINTGKITFKWARNGNPPGTMYQAQLALNDDFSSGLVESNWITAISFDFTSLAANTSYYFRVRAKNSANPVEVQTPFTIPVSATTSAKVPIALTVLPADIDTGKITFKWNDNGNPWPGTMYQAQRALNDDFSSGLVESDWTPAARFDFTNLAADTLYYFRVRAKNCAKPVGVQTAFAGPVSAKTLANTVRSVSIGAPSALATLSGPVTVSANVSGSGVSRVEFFAKRIVDGVVVSIHPIGRDDTSPYSLTWNTAANPPALVDGNYALTAKANYGVGTAVESVLESAPVNVKVENGGGQIVPSPVITVHARRDGPSVSEIPAAGPAHVKVTGLGPTGGAFCAEALDTKKCEVPANWMGMAGANRWSYDAGKGEWWLEVDSVSALVGPGKYTLWCRNTAAMASVTVTVNRKELVASPASLSFYVVFGDDPPAQTLKVSLAGAVPPKWGAESAGGSLLTVTPQSQGNLRVSVNSAGLAVGSYSGAITVTADDATNSPLTVPVTLTVDYPPTPEISNEPSVAATVGAEFRLQIKASNNPTRFEALDLPLGLSIDARSGLITGTPLSAGTSIVRLRAHKGPATGSANLELRVGWGCKRTNGPIDTNVLGIGQPAGLSLEDADKLGLLGVEWVRTDLSWSSMEPSEGIYTWGELDRLVAGLKGKNIKLLLQFTYVPGWVWAKDRQGRITAMYHFARALAAHLRWKVRYYEVFNEPNLPGIGFFRQNDAVDPAIYLDFLAAANRGIREADKDAVVVLGGLSPDGMKPSEFWQELYELGAKDCFDVLAYHPYGSASFRDTADRIRQGMKSYDDSEKPIWFNELGESDDSLRVRFLSQMRAELEAVPAWFWFSLRDFSTTDTFGLLDQDHKVKPAAAGPSAYELFKEIVAGNKPPAPPLSAPASDVSASAVTVNWDPADGNPPGTEYYAERATNSGFTEGLGDSGWITARSAAFTGLNPSTRYYFRVKARNLRGVESAPTVLPAKATLAGAPAAASMLWFTHNSVTVQWTPPASGAQSYRVEASKSADFAPGALSRSAAKPGAAGLTTRARLTVHRLEVDTEYHLRIAALNPDGVATYAPDLSVTTARTPTANQLTAGAETTVSSVFPSDTQHIKDVRLQVPAESFPSETHLSVVTDVRLQLPPPWTNQGRLTPLGSSVGVAITAEGLQPKGLLTITMTYDPASLGGRDPQTMQMASFSEGSDQWSLLPTKVDPRTMTITAVTPHLSLFAPFFVTPAADLAAVQVFPQPWEIGDAGSAQGAPKLTFSNLPAAAKVRLLTITGELLWEERASAGGVLNWDGNTRFGGKAASGTYLALVEAGGLTKVRRVVIIR